MARIEIAMSSTFNHSPSIGANVAAEATADLYAKYVLQNYGKQACTLTRGAGAYVWDEKGKRLLDFTTGIAVNALGHCHPDWVAKVQQQVATLGHCSNLYAHAPQGLLAKRIVDKAGTGKVFFCNSGAEANEALIKFARLFGRKQAGAEGKQYTIITAENAFHGRTFGGMACTPQEKIQGGFRPMLPGFKHARLNAIDSFEQAIDTTTAAVLIESIQGEGGIHAADTKFLQDLRTLCDEHNLLLLIDEVQCGIGRSGHFFAFEQAAIQPDAIGMAKGLGGGFPIGAVWIREPYTDVFKPGSHGSTFGGNPMACAAALAVLDVIEHDQLLERVRQQSKIWHQDLRTLQKTFPKLLAEVRGMGYMVGLALHVDPTPIVNDLREAGLLTVPAGGQVIRLLPPLTASATELKAAVDILSTVFSQQ